MLGRCHWRHLSSDCLLNASLSSRRQLRPGDIVRIPPHVEIKTLSHILNRPVKELTRAFCKRGDSKKDQMSKKSYSYIRDLDGVRYEFPASTSVVLPYSLASAYARRLGFDSEKIVMDPEYEITPESHSRSDHITGGFIRKLPVVSIMGHIDHGKTTLLDTLTGSMNAASEPGMITQDVRAITTTFHPSMKPLTLLDTPGHFHFDRIRENSAVVADAVILVVACDEGLLAQSYDVIQWAAEHNLKMIVALNKIDVASDLQVKAIKKSLRQAGVDKKETKMIEISAKRGDNLNVLKSELQVITDSINKVVDPSVPAEAVVLESLYQAGAGIILRALVQCGRLQVGQSFVCGYLSGRVKALRDCKGQSISEALPGSLVEVLGGKKSRVDAAVEPPLGDTLFAVSKERAVEIMEARTLERRFESARLSEEDEESVKPLTAEEEKEMLSNPHMLQEVASDTDGTLNLVIKANTAGSLDVLRNYLLDIPGIGIASSSIGEISVSDLDASLNHNNCPILCYRVRPNPGLRRMVQKKRVKIFYDNVLHRLIDLAREEAGSPKPFATVKPLAHEGKKGTFFI